MQPVAQLAATYAHDHSWTDTSQMGGGIPPKTGQINMLYGRKLSHSGSMLIMQWGEGGGGTVYEFGIVRGDRGVKIELIALFDALIFWYTRG